MEKQVDTSNEIQRQRTEHHGDVGALKEPSDMAGAKEAFTAMSAELAGVVREEIKAQRADIDALRAELDALRAETHQG